MLQITSDLRFANRNRSQTARFGALRPKLSELSFKSGSGSYAPGQIIARRRCTQVSAAEFGGEAGQSLNINQYTSTLAIGFYSRLSLRLRDSSTSTVLGAQTNGLPNPIYTSN